MATGNKLYPLWKQALMQELPDKKSLDQSDAANGCYASLVGIGAGAYNYSNAHQFYSDITNVQGTAGQIGNPLVTGTIFSGDLVVYTNVTGVSIGAVVMHRQNTGANTTWRLVLYEDTGVIGLPMIPNGGNIILKWNTAGIFSLGQPAI